MRRFFAFVIAIALGWNLAPHVADQVMMRTLEQTQVEQTQVQPADVEAARAILAGIEVKGRAPKTGYEREQYGQRWADVDRNGCDTRNDMLARDLADVTYREGTRDCVVTTGILTDPYTGQVIDFVRGEDTSNEVHIDHVVSLSWAWQHGAAQMDADQRLVFANDPINLLAVAGPVNMAKSDHGPGAWLPKKPYRCDYAVTWAVVLDSYGLWVNPADHAMLTDVLASC